MCSFRVSWGRKIRWAVLGAGLAGVLAAPALQAQRANAPTGPKVQPRFDITSLYTSSGGVGLGGGVDVLGVPLAASRLSLDAYVAQHAGEYEAAFFPRDLFYEGVGGGVSVGYFTHGRLAFYGLGPASTENNKVLVERDELLAAAHVGLRRGPAGVIGTVGYRDGKLRSYRDDVDNAFSRLDAASAARLARDRGQQVTGATAGAVAYLDRRDTPGLARRGFLLTAGGEQFFDLRGGDYPFARFHGSATGFFPAGTFTLVARGLALHTVAQGEALPLVLLPHLGHRVAIGPGPGRLAGNDLVVFDVQVQHALPNRNATYGTRGFVALSAYNAYDNLFTDARLAPSWAEKFAPARRYPLRAAVGVGVHVFQRDTGAHTLTGTLGLSADGVAFSTFFNYDPRRLRIPWRW